MPVLSYVIWLGENISTFRNNVEIILLIIITGSSGKNKKVYFSTEPTSSPTNLVLLVLSVFILYRFIINSEILFSSWASVFNACEF